MQAIWCNDWMSDLCSFYFNFYVLVLLASGFRHLNRQNPFFAVFLPTKNYIFFTYGSAKFKCHVHIAYTRINKLL